MFLDPLHLDAVEKIIRNSAGHRADQVLKAELKKSNFDASERSIIARSVFAFYQWHGWLNPENAIQENIRAACELRDDFNIAPKNLSDEALLQKALPGWIETELQMFPAWIRQIQKEPLVWLRVKNGALENVQQELREPNLQSGPLPNAVCYSGRKDLFTSPSFHHGNFELQDIASQAVGWICGPKPGELWWDVCSGEGGKALHLSDLMANKGLIWCTDRSRLRLKTLQRRAARAGMFNYRMLEWNVEKKMKTRFQGVLLDAPCSGVGSWQRNPQARWTTKLDDLVELQQLQLKLLRKSAMAVQIGGKLVYAVCTMTRKETTEVVEHFNREFPHFEPEVFAHPFDPKISPAAFQFLWPHQTLGNGMFVAVWRRKGLS